VFVSGGGGAEGMTVVDETVKLVPAGSAASFRVSAPGATKADFDVTVTGKSR